MMRVIDQGGEAPIEKVPDVSINDLGVNITYGHETKTLQNWLFDAQKSIKGQTNTAELCIQLCNHIWSNRRRYSNQWKANINTGNEEQKRASKAMLTVAHYLESLRDNHGVVDQGVEKAGTITQETLSAIRSAAGADATAPRTLAAAVSEAVPDESVGEPSPDTTTPKSALLPRTHFDPSTLQFTAPKIGRGDGGTTLSAHILTAQPTRRGWWNRHNRPEVSLEPSPVTSTVIPDVDGPLATEAITARVSTELRDVAKELAEMMAPKVTGPLSAMIEKMQSRIDELERQLESEGNPASDQMHDLQEEIARMRTTIDDLTQERLFEKKSREIVSALTQMNMGRLDTSKSPEEQAFIAILWHSMTAPYPEWGGDEVRKVEVRGNSLFAQLDEKSIALDVVFHSDGSGDVVGRVVSSETVVARTSDNDNDMRISFTATDLKTLITNFYDDYNDEVEGEERVQKDSLGVKFTQLYKKLSESTAYRGARSFLPYPRF